jgi:hypothetical protein
MGHNPFFYAVAREGLEVDLIGDCCRLAVTFQCSPTHFLDLQMSELWRLMERAADVVYEMRKG